MTDNNDRKPLAEELAHELSALANRLDEKLNDLEPDWKNLSRPERWAVGSIRKAYYELRCAVEDINEHTDS